MQNAGNWLRAIYARIDSSANITGVDEKEIRKEIEWAYKLEYITQEERETLEEYLEREIAEKAESFKLYRKARIEEIRENQQRLINRQRYQSEVAELFRTGMEYDFKTHTYRIKAKSDKKGSIIS